MKIILYIGLMVFTLYMGGMYWSSLLVMLFIVEIVLGIVLLLLAYYLAIKTDVSINNPSDFITKDERRDFRVRVRNRSYLPITSFLVQVTYQETITSNSQILKIQGAVGAKQTVSIPMQVTVSKCGQIQLQIKRITVYDYLGIFGIRRKQKKGCLCYVLPQQKAISIHMKNRTLIDAQGATVRERKMTNGQVADYDVREYQEGDSLRHIHWKLQAKTGDLWTKEYYEEEQTVLPIYLDMNRIHDSTPATWDAFIEVVSAFSYGLLQLHMAHTLSWYDGALQKMQSAEVLEIDGLMSVLVTLLSSMVRTHEQYKSRYLGAQTKVLDTQSIHINMDLKISFGEKIIHQYTVINYEKEIEKEWLDM